MIERIVCAAIRNQNGDIICGVRHFDNVMRNTIKASTKNWAVCEQGFLDNKGNFLSREEAYKIATAANQIIRQVSGEWKELFSENLY